MSSGSRLVNSVRSDCTDCVSYDHDYERVQCLWPVNKCGIANVSPPALATKKFIFIYSSSIFFFRGSAAEARRCESLHMDDKAAPTHLIVGVRFFYFFANERMCADSPLDRFGICLSRAASETHTHTFTDPSLSNTYGNTLNILIHRTGAATTIFSISLTRSISSATNSQHTPSHPIHSCILHVTFGTYTGRYANIYKAISATHPLISDTNNAESKRKTHAHTFEPSRRHGAHSWWKRDSEKQTLNDMK